MPHTRDSVVSLIGRILLSAIFIWSGISKIASFSSMAGVLAPKGVPFPTVAFGIAVAIELLGGLAILTGFHARIAAWIVFLYLIPTTLLFHNFWAFQGAARMDNEAHFMKNVAIMGGLLILAANGAGGCSCDAARVSRA
ncbi:MAG TPA: DoxX family protein [Candidatus Acidoferrales bacterium]|nr:DoxX family protein [Candidatus Acidoferrales bacterium]